MKAARLLPAPRDSFSGLDAPAFCWPRQVLAFARLSRRDLQRSTLESRPHHRHVLIINLRTPGVVNLDGTPFPLRPGEARLVSPYQMHTCHEIEAESICWLFITFELEESAPLDHLRNVNVALDPAMRAAAEAFVGRYLAAAGRRSEAVSPLAQIAPAELLARLAEAEGFRPRIARRGGAHAAALMHRIRRALREALTTARLAARLGYSDSRLRALFHEAFGTGLGEYLRGFRLHEAVALMRHTDMKLGAIADACGFNSQSGFCRTFRAWAGVTPAEFRKNLRRPPARAAAGPERTPHRRNARGVSRRSRAPARR